MRDRSDVLAESPETNLDYNNGREREDTDPVIPRIRTRLRGISRGVQGSMARRPRARPWQQTLFIILAILAVISLILTSLITSAPPPPPTPTPFPLFLPTP